ncbi:MAG: hypothetical protein AAGC77_02445 [Pseudomonadota bacterium]
MAVFRFIAWVLVSLAIALLGADAITALESQEPALRSTAYVLGLFGFEFGAGGEAASGFGKAMTTILSLPLWGVLGIIGIVLTLIFRPIE